MDKTLSRIRCDYEDQDADEENEGEDDSIIMDNFDNISREEAKEQQNEPQRVDQEYSNDDHTDEEQEILQYYADRSQIHDLVDNPKEAREESSEQQIPQESIRESEESSGLCKLVKDGRSDSNISDNQESSDVDVEELDNQQANNCNPSFLAFGEDNRESSESLSEKDKNKSDIKGHSDVSKIVKNGDENEEDSASYSFLESINEGSKDCPKKNSAVKPLDQIPLKNVDVFGQPDPEHVEDPFEKILKKRDQNEIQVNNQNFDNNVYGAPEEGKEEEKMSLQRHSLVRFRQRDYSVFEPVFSKKINRVAGHELPRASPFSFIASKLRESVVGLSEEQADQLMRVDETDGELSNQDVVL